MGLWRLTLVAAGLALAAKAAAQSHESHGKHTAADTLQHDAHADRPVGASGTHSGEGSGTARLPARETRRHGAMIGLGGEANLMLHGYAWPVYTRQTGLRGDEKLYTQSMAMATVIAPFGGGRFTTRTMLSLEPLMRHDGYPNLLSLIHI